MQIRTIGIDLGKAACDVAAIGGCGRVVARRRLARTKLVPWLADLPPAGIGMEASCAHHLVRRLNELGHDVRLMPARPDHAGRSGSPPSRSGDLRRVAASDPAMNLGELLLRRCGDQETQIDPSVETATGRRRLERHRPVRFTPADLEQVLAAAVLQAGEAGLERYQCLVRVDRPRRRQLPVVGELGRVDRHVVGTRALPPVRER